MKHFRPVTFVAVAALGVAAVLSGMAWTQDASTSQVDPAVQQAARLEVELAGYKDTSPEAADLLAKIMDLYYSSGHVFGVIRTGQKFTARQSADKRHQAMMLKLLDGLEAVSRNEEVITTCRQFLDRYPNDPASASVEVRLARTLERGDRLAGAGAWQAVWRRQGNTAAGREAGARALGLCESLRSGEAVKLANEIAGEMVDKLPATELTGEVGMRAFNLLASAGQYAEANSLANKMLAKGKPADKVLLRELHRRMAYNYQQVRQYANAAVSLKKALAIEGDGDLQSQLVLLLHQAQAPPAELEAACTQFAQKYPDHQDRHERLAYVAQAYEAAKNLPGGQSGPAKALELYKSILNHAPQALEAARRVTHLAGDKPEQVDQSEKLLLESIRRCPAQAHYVTYVLATEIYDRRMKDRDKARKVLRDRLLNDKTESSYAVQCAQWLLQTAEDQDEFRRDVDALVELRRAQAQAGGGQHDYFSGLSESLRNDKKKRVWLNYLEQARSKMQADPVLGVWLSLREGTASDQRENVRVRLMRPGAFEKLPKPLQITVASEQTRYARHRSSRRSSQLAAYSLWAKVEPDNFEAVAGMFSVAADENKVAPAKEALEALLRIDPSKAAQPSEGLSPYLAQKMLSLAEREKNADLARKAYAWIRKAAGKDPVVDVRIGDSLLALKLEKEALEYWTWALGEQVDSAPALECAARIRKQAPGDQRSRLDKQWMDASRRYRAAYGTWLADDYLAARDLNNFEKLLRDLIAHERERTALAPAVDVNLAASWLELCRLPVPKDEDKNALSEADRKRVLAAVRDLGAGNASAVAHVVLLATGEADKMKPMERLLAYQSATRLLSNDWYDWARLQPLAQKLVEAKQYAPASVLLTGLLANASRTEESRRDAARALVAQCYAQMGQVGMTIDDKSPLAPLMRATLYLRLGDQRLALEALTAHRKLLAAHRQELPADLLIFACQNLISAGGEENLGDVENWLREWTVRNAESKQIADDVKAQVQLLLAQGYFKAQRYDVARAEFTTVLNRFPSTPQALEAQFGIGETHLAQKVYDQALAIFDKLAQSRDIDVVVRAEFLRGVVAFQRGEVDEARGIFRSVLDRVPNIQVADKALFRLSEIYGLEQRYLEQLTLLRTVGRLGRTSKRSHTPGQSLAIVVYDSDLGISRGHNRIPVTVTTEPGGDKEVVYLTSAGAGKGLFRADLDTRLGQVAPHNRILELSGRDTIHCDYPEEFRAQFKHVPLSNVEITIAADGKLQMASTKEFDEKKVSFSEQLQKEVEQPKEEQDQRVSQARPVNQVKPGNPIYVRVTDVDRDMGDQADPLIVKVAADSGDQVQVTLQETGPHTGVFEGMVQTGELPAGAIATDAALDQPAVLAIDTDPKTFWQSKPDGKTPKTLTVDMKDLKSVAGVRVTVPDPANRAPVRAELRGSYDGVFFFRLGGNPAIEKGEGVAAQYGRMTRRVYDGDFTKLTKWNDVVELAKAKPVEEGQADDLIYPSAAPGAPKPPTREGDEKKPQAVIFHGKLVQRRTGAARIQVAGACTALMVDGRIELPPAKGAQDVDLWLTAGTHDVTVFAAATDVGQTVGATWARADLSSASVTLRPFLTTDFDLTLTEAQKPGAPAVDAELKRADNVWDFRFVPADLRYVSLVVHEYLGDAVAIGLVEVFGPREGERHIPPNVDLVALASNHVLEIAGGDTVTATYVDEVTPGDGGRSRILTASLTATYFNAELQPIIYAFTRSGGGSVSTSARRVLRIEPGERFIVQVRDYDEDRTNDRDTVPFQIVINDDKPITLTATETEPNTGVFTKEVDTAPLADKPKTQPASQPAGSEKVFIKPGDRIFCRYLDRQNTFPGHGVHRENVVLINQPTEGRMWVLDTLVEAPPPPRTGGDKPVKGQPKGQPKAQPKAQAARPLKVAYRRPDEGRQVSQVALAAPMTVEVIDPDMAKDAESFVIVTLQTDLGALAAGPQGPATRPATAPATGPMGMADTQPATQPAKTLQVRCVLPPNTQGGSGNDDALMEGRFVGQVFLQLGGPASPDTIPLVAGMPRLTGGPVLEEETDKDKKAQTSSTRVLNVGGQDVIQAAYVDQRRPDKKTAELPGRARLIENGTVACTDPAYDLPIDQLYLGERLYVRVIDGDRDVSEQRDTLTVKIVSTSGEEEMAELAETLPHSGVFTGSFVLRAAQKPVKGNLLAAPPSGEKDKAESPTTRPASDDGLAGAPRTGAGTVSAEPAIEAFFGDTVTVTYVDPVALTETGKLEALFEAPVAVGSDGLVRSFSKAFADEKLSVETRFTIAECYFELFKSHRRLERLDDARTALRAGRAVLRELVEEQLEPRYAPRVAYLLGQFAQELGQWDEAINAYQSILRQYGDHPLAPDSQYKLAQTYEEMGDFDLALEAYVALAATYPKSALVSSVMIRVADYFYKKETFDVAAEVGEKFVEKFQTHQYAPQMAFRVGQCRYKQGKFTDAGKAFDRFARVFAEDKLCSDALFWAGESYRMGRNNRLAYQRYNRCRWDFPASEAAKYARGRLALPEMLSQFEADSKEVENPDQ